MYTMTITLKTAECERTVFTSKEVLQPQWIINQAIQGFDFGKLTAQTKCMTQGVLAFERGLITYNKVKE